MTIQDVEIVIKPQNEKRFMIVQKTSGKVLHDAGGYGFCSKAKARNVMNFIFNGGLAYRKNIRNWWKEHNQFRNKVDDLVFNGWQNGLSEQEINKEIEVLADDMFISDFKMEYLRYI